MLKKLAEKLKKKLTGSLSHRNRSGACAIPVVNGFHRLAAIVLRLIVVIHRSKFNLPNAAFFAI